MLSPLQRNSAADVLMIRPARFAGNPDTRESNAFQSASSGDPQADRRSARDECDRVAEALRAVGVRVHLFDDRPVPARPDAVFPNNWVSFHRDGTIVVYPMMSARRRLERRLDVLEELVTVRGFRATRFVDLSHHELAGRYLEGTGSLVLDRIGQVAYACPSPRTDLEALLDFSHQLGYETVTFQACDRDGKPVYHTNVMMTLGTRFAAVCLESIRSPERSAVVARLTASGREIIELTIAQMRSFAGNMIELGTQDGTTLVAMSASAHASLTDAQRVVLERAAGRLVAVAVPTIERVGGGSVRCMIAEIHLPRHD